MPQSRRVPTCFRRPRLTGLALAALLASCRGEPPASQTQALVASSEESCTVSLPAPSPLAPELQWEWTASSTLSDFRRVLAAPVVVDLTGDGIPEVVFNSARPDVIISSLHVEAASSALGSGAAVVRAVRGDTGAELWTVTAPELTTQGARGLAAGDLDGDGRPEVCTLSEDSLSVLCFRGDGTLYRRITEPARATHRGELTLADLDGDGRVEILDGTHVYNGDGTPRWASQDAFLGNTAIAADLDLDGKQEVLMGPMVYRHDGTPFCSTLDQSIRASAVANLDADPQGEFVQTYGEHLSLFDTDCSLLWTVRVEGASLDMPNIADFDGDGQPEVGVGGAGAYVVFEADGTEKWRMPLASQGRASSTTFDFDADGQAEVLINDEAALFFRNAATGALRVQYLPGASYGQQAPLVVDVDGDGSAEVVVASAFPPGIGRTGGLRVLRNQGDDWPATRPIWNQQAWSVTHVNDDGTLPARPEVNWLVPGLNTFLSNAQFPRAAPAADLSASQLSGSCSEDETALLLGVRVDNRGSAPVSGEVRVAFYSGPPSEGGTLLGTVPLGAALQAGGSTSVFLSRPASERLGTVYAVVDDDGAGGQLVTECDEGNNTTSATLDLRCVSNQAPVALCRDVTVSADAQCLGTGGIDHGSHDPDGQPSPLSLSQAPEGPFGLGSHLVTLTASDGLESAQCTSSVTVVDTTAPALSCPSEPVRVCGGRQGAHATWSLESSDACGPAPTSCSHASGSLFPQGRTDVTCAATDGSGNSTSCAFSVVVQNDSPPTLGEDKGLTLWPPNHRSVTVSLEDCAAPARDSCGGELPLGEYGRILHVTSDEDEDGRGNGDGHTCGDVELAGGEQPTSVRLRAEREGTSDGRVYTVHYAVTDASGNSTTGTCRVSVPHHPGRTAVAGDTRYCVGEGCTAGTDGSPLCH